VIDNSFGNMVSSAITASVSFNKSLDKHPLAEALTSWMSCCYRTLPRRTRLTIASKMTAPMNETSIAHSE